MAAPTAVETSAAPTMAAASAAEQAAKPGLSSGRVGSRTTSMAEPAEGAGMRSCRWVRGVGSVKSLVPRTTSAIKIAAMIEVCSTRMKTVAIDDGPAMRDVGVVVVDDSPVVMPIISPVVPTPAEAAKESDPKAQSKSDSWAVQEKSWIRIPTGENGEGVPIHQPGIVLRYVNHVGRCGLNDDRFSLSTYLLLGRRVQVAGLLSPLSHGLNRLGQFLLLVDIHVAQF